MGLSWKTYLIRRDIIWRRILIVGLTGVVICGLEVLVLMERLGLEDNRSKDLGLCLPVFRVVV